MSKALNTVAENDMCVRYANDLNQVVRKHLDQSLSRKVDPEDVVQSVFRSFIRRNRNGQFQIESENALLALLRKIAIRKCYRKYRDYSCSKRDIRREAHVEDGSKWAAKSATPIDVVVVRETIETCLDGLTEFQRDAVLLRMANYSTAEIVERIGRTQRTVRRILEKFRERLEFELG